MANKISNIERYVAVTAYLLELGYFISFLTKGESEFTKYHFNQESKIITRVLLPGLVIFFISILWESSVSKILIYLGSLVVILSFILSLIGAIYAFKGKLKKVL